MNMKLLFEDTSSEMIEIKTKFNEWNINRFGDDVFIECWEDDGNGHTVLALNQDELKTLIAFLQRQVK